jgi:hypothetical protein
MRGRERDTHPRCAQIRDDTARRGTAGSAPTTPSRSVNLYTHLTRERFTASVRASVRCVVQSSTGSRRNARDVRTQVRTERLHTCTTNVVVNIDTEYISIGTGTLRSARLPGGPSTVHAARYSIEIDMHLYDIARSGIRELERDSLGLS